MSWLARPTVIRYFIKSTSNDEGEIYYGRCEYSTVLKSYYHTSSLGLRSEAQTGRK